MSAVTEFARFESADRYAVVDGRALLCRAASPISGANVGGMGWRVPTAALVCLQQCLPGVPLEVHVRRIAADGSLRGDSGIDAYGELT